MDYNQIIQQLMTMLSQPQALSTPDASVTFRSASDIVSLLEALARAQQAQTPIEQQMRVSQWEYTRG